MKIERYFWMAVVIAMAIYIFFLQTCNGTKGKGNTVGCGDIVKIEVQKSPRYFPVYTPVPYEVQLPGQTILDTIDFTDTNYCKDVTVKYLTENTYKDTLHTDTIDIYVEEIVQQNAIKSRLIGYKILKPFVTIADDRFQVFVAGNLGTDGKGFVAGPELMFKPKNNYLFKVGVDFNTTGVITYRVGFGFLIRFKKRIK